MVEISMSTSWKTKRRYRHSCARMRELKRAKLLSSSASAELGGFSSDLDVTGGSLSLASTNPSTSTAPTSSSSLPSTSSAPGTSLSDPRSSLNSQHGDRSVDKEENSKHSESENKRDLSGSSSDDADSPFDNNMAQDIFDDWVVSLPLTERKMLAVMLMETVQKRFNIKSTAAALEATWITGFNEKTVRKYRKEFFENRGKFKDEARGKYKRFCLFNEEALCLQASMWIRENAVKKGAPNLVARRFCQWVNNELLPSSDLSPNLSRSITVTTATRWLHWLEFQPTSHKKGAYVDGHEREDVIGHRKKISQRDEVAKGLAPSPTSSK